jgi:hypothetical protein
MKILCATLLLLIGFSGRSQNQLSFTIPDCPSASLSELKLNSVLIFPNPNQGLFQVRIDEKIEGLNLIIYACNGLKILEHNNILNDFEIDLTSYENGVYFIRLESLNYIHTELIIKN